MPAAVESAVNPGELPFSAEGKRLGVFVISYNAEKFITDTLNRIPECIWKAVEVVYVVDDCSLDDTTHRVLSYPDAHGKLKVFRNRINRRYGGNQKFGYQYAIDNGLDAVVMLHGDGQYAPEMLPDLFRPLVRDEADVVIGSRMIRRKDALAGGMPRYKFMANIALTWIENLLSGMRLSEFHSGYRGYSTRFLKRIPLWKNSDEWHFDSQILFQARQASAKICELPIPTHYGDEVCHVNGIAYGLNCLWSAFLFRLHRMKLLHLARYDLAPATLADSRKFDDPYSSHTLIYNRLRMMPLSGARVLDLGFGCAAIASRLRKHGAVIDGVDLSPAAVAENRELFANVYQKDLNRLDEVGLKEKYDIVLCADILQFLVDPADVLSRLKKYMVRGGLLVISIPNFVNLSTRLHVLFGRFPLHHRGIIEEKALHFFTNAEFQQLLKRTSWELVDSTVSNLPLILLFPFLKRRMFRPLIGLCRGMTVLMKGLFGYQCIYFCKNPNDSDLL